MTTPKLQQLVSIDNDLITA